MLAVNSWRKLHKLSRLELTLLAQALLLLPLTALCVRFFGFRRLYAAMAKLSRGDKCVAATVTQSQPRADAKCLTQAYAIARIVSLASWRGFYRANCLQQSLVLWWLLRRQGIETDLRIGVRKHEQRFEAHAWVEYLGIVLNDRNDVHQRFAPFAGAILPLKEQIL